VGTLETISGGGLCVVEVAGTVQCQRVHKTHIMSTQGVRYMGFVLALACVGGGDSGDGGRDHGKTQERRRQRGVG
jgi:hypothetical protein